MAAPPTSAAGTVARSPQVSVHVGKPDPATGRVLIRVHARDRSTSLRLRPPARTAKGSIAVATGQGTPQAALSYRPDAAARHQAARDTAGPADTRDAFNVTVADGYGGSTSIPVTVEVSPQNAPPIANPVVGIPDALGVVTGNIGASDPDGDPLAYSLSSQPSGGSVDLAPDGGFTYRPRSTAPRSTAPRSSRAAGPGSADWFAITISDGYGGSTSVPVTVTRAATSLS